MKKNFLVLMFLSFLFISCSTINNDETKISIKNNLDMNRTDELITLSLRELNIKENSILQIIDKTINEECVYQYSDLNGDEKKESFQILININANSEKILTIKQSNKETKFTKRTFAEISYKKGGYFKEKKYVGGKFYNGNFLRVPAEHTDHSEYIKYEGPGWESDKVGFRFYLDWRNAIDIFGKKINDMTLMNVGLIDFDRYHEPNTWGMDVLKVGSSLGMGSFGSYQNEKIFMVSEVDSTNFFLKNNGDVFSSLKTDYFNWNSENDKKNISSTISIEAGKRYSRNHLIITPNDFSMCTGIVKAENTNYFSSESKGKWNYIATYGKQSVIKDNLGMFVFYKNENLKELKENEENQIIVFNKGLIELEYLFGAAWEQEPNGITNEKEFTVYLNETLQKLNSELKVNVIN